MTVQGTHRQRHTPTRITSWKGPIASLGDPHRSLSHGIQSSGDQPDTGDWARVNGRARPAHEGLSVVRRTRTGARGAVDSWIEPG